MARFNSVHVGLSNGANDFGCNPAVCRLVNHCGTYYHYFGVFE